MKNNASVIIIGAGAAGLGAASILVKHNVDVIVLEGFDRFRLFFLKANQISLLIISNYYCSLLICFLY